MWSGVVCMCVFMCGVMWTKVGCVGVVGCGVKWGVWMCIHIFSKPFLHSSIPHVAKVFEPFKITNGNATSI